MRLAKSTFYAILSPQLESFRQPFKSLANYAYERSWKNQLRDFE